MLNLRLLPRAGTVPLVEEREKQASGAPFSGALAFVKTEEVQVESNTRREASSLPDEPPQDSTHHQTEEELKVQGVQ